VPHFISLSLSLSLSLPSSRSIPIPVGDKNRCALFNDGPLARPRCKPADAVSPLRFSDKERTNSDERETERERERGSKRHSPLSVSVSLSLSLFLCEKEDDSSLALYARVVKKARRFIRRASIEIGPAYDRARKSGTSRLSAGRRRERGRRGLSFNGTRARERE